jgi:putative toxin-antitoxin system antitoxin component (TIGR02293 family)
MLPIIPPYQPDRFSGFRPGCSPLEAWLFLPLWCAGYVQCKHRRIRRLRPARENKGAQLFRMAGVCVALVLRKTRCPIGPHGPENWCKMRPSEFDRMARSAQAQHAPIDAARLGRRREPPVPENTLGNSAAGVISLAFEAGRGFSKASAAKLFQRIAATSSLPAGRVRAELIPDSSWKRARKTLGPQASQSTARLSHVLSIAERVWGNEKDAIEWLTGPHPELQDQTPLSFLRTEAGGRAVEALLGALEFGFPV